MLTNQIIGNVDVLVIPDLLTNQIIGNVDVLVITETTPEASFPNGQLKIRDLKFRLPSGETVISMVEGFSFL